MASIILRFRLDPRVLLWRASVGAVKIGERFLRFGVAGQADLTGILAGDAQGRGAGKRIEVEVKSATGKQSEHQKAYQEVIEKFGGLYVLARSADDVERAIKGAMTQDPQP